MKTVCPKCYQGMELKDEQEGSSVECTACHESFTALPAKICRHCGALTPKSSHTCCKCGKSTIGIGIRKPGETLSDSTPAPAAKDPAEHAGIRKIGIRKPGEMSSPETAESAAPAEKPAEVKKIAFRKPDAPAAPAAESKPAPVEPAPVESAPATESAPAAKPAAPSVPKLSVPKVGLHLPGSTSSAAPAAGGPGKLTLPKMPGAPSGAPKLNIPKPAPAVKKESAPAAESKPAPSLSIPAVPKKEAAKPAAPAPAVPKKEESKPAAAAPAVPTKEGEKPAAAPSTEPKKEGEKPAEEKKEPVFEPLPPPEPKPPLIEPETLKKILKIAAIVIGSLAILGGAAYGVMWYLNGPYKPDEQLAKGKELYEKGKKEKAIAMLERAANNEQGENVDAIILLAGYYETGDGAPKDLKKAMQYYKRAADRQNAEGEFALGRFYEKGIGVPADIKQGMEYYEKASKRGHVKASVELSRCFDAMAKEASDPRKILETKRQAAEGGDPASQLYMAKLFLAGYDVQLDQKKALEYLTSVTEKGLAEGAYLLGDCYRTGIGGVKDPAKAKEAYTKACTATASVDENSDNEMDMLIQAKCLLNGYGCEKKDPEKATLLLRKLVEKKNPAAMTALALSLPDDSPERAALLKESAEAGEPEAKFGLLAKENSEEALNEMKKIFKSGYLTGGPVLAEKFRTSSPAKALEFAKASYERNVPGSRFIMAGYYLSGTPGLEKDVPKALELYWASASDPDDPSCEKAVKTLQKISAVKEYQMPLVTMLTPLAAPSGAEANPENNAAGQEQKEAGNPLAKKLMAYFYRFGICVPKDLPKAVDYYWASKSLDELISMLDARQEPEKILELLSTAANEGNVALQYRLGTVYISGRAVKRDTAKGLEWLKKAAEGGSADALYYLGMLTYQENAGDLYLRDPVIEGIKKSWKDGGVYFAKAAKLGHAAAQYRYGLYLISTKKDVEGVADKKAEAYASFKASAAQGYIPAVFQMVLNGLENYDKLSSEQKKNLYALLMQTVDAGYVPALFAMGEVAWAAGDAEQAGIWYGKAAARDYVPALIVLNKFRKNYSLINHAVKIGYLPAVAEEAVRIQKKEKDKMADAIKLYDRVYKHCKCVANNFGTCFVQSRRKLALKYFKEAAEHGSVTALYNLGFYYYKDEADKQVPDYTKALSYFEQVAAKPESGITVPPDLCENLKKMMQLEKNFRNTQQKEKKKAISEELGTLTDRVVGSLSWKTDSTFYQSFHDFPAGERYPWKTEADVTLLKDFYK